MTQLSTLPSAAEQARQALLLLGAPAPARKLVDVHAALFDSDLSVPAVLRLLHDRAPGLCPALNADLTAARGVIALAEWPLERRIVTPAAREADSLAMILRVSEFVGLRAHAGLSASRLLQTLAADVPDGFDGLPAALALSSARVASEEPARASAVARAALLDLDQQLYGVTPSLPHQRDAS